VAPTRLAGKGTSFGPHFKEARPCKARFALPIGRPNFYYKVFTLISTYGIGEKKLHFGTFRFFLLFFSVVPIRVSFVQFCDVAKLEITHKKI
jgi:hypothetical protein